MSLDLVKLHDTALVELRRIAKEAGVDLAESLRRDDLVFAIAQASSDGALYGQGVLEVHTEGFGFLRAAADNFLPGDADIYVSQSQIRRFKLHTGDTVIGIVRPPKEGERYTALLRVESVNGEPPGDEPPAFGTLTAIAPDDRVALHGRPSLRALGQIAPLALGHRGLVLAPTRIAHAGFLRDLVDVITEDEELVVNVLLVGAPPEDITVWRRECAAEVIATPFDETQARQLQVADIAFERARRLVERGEDVVVVVDSLTRLARACQAEVPAVGRQLGDLDAAAMQRIHHYFGAARALEDGGSLTVIAVLSTETSDRVARSLAEDLDEVVTWRATLSAEVADRGVRPPLHASRCWSRGAESLLEPHEREQLAGFRASLTGEPVTDAGLLAEATGANPLLDSVARTGN